MPFVTEELYSILPDSPLKDAKSIMISSFPRKNENYIYPESSSEMEYIMELINGIRNIRGENNISLGKEINILINTQKQDVISANSDYLKTQCRANKIEFTNNPKIDLTASKIIGDTTVFIPLKGLVDVESEMARVKKQLNKVLKDIDFVSKKLNNPKFIDKAPQKVVEKEKTKLEDYQKIKENLEKDLANLEKLK